ncbi:hypothetical protein [Roseimicrobium sp. ORNL1]|uniref:hypothetical protein n=1 Tax=Roseimicrobium sp. ORNL1 TaxID=2711231 RepID=UPI0013E16820|nr:hypothetical protein [Roseimicrobium sp. ORNL1]QIF01644.1 hypothetical protein G5S37_08945 [Roseimicrobium sp. ORNL1]
MHSYLYRVAAFLKPWCSEDESFQLLKQATANCGRRVPDREIWQAVRNSKNDWKPGHTGNLSLPKLTPLEIELASWPRRDYEAIERIAADGFSRADLWEHSPVRLEDETTDAESMIEALFPGDPLICVGRKVHAARTAHRSTFRGRFGALSYVVPSAMSKPIGKTQDGQDSARSLQNCGPRQWHVLECDFKQEGEIGRILETHSLTVQDLCAAVLWHLAHERPMVCAVHSGGKSIHGWYPAHGVTEARTRAFHRLAVSLGCDPITHNPVQWVRLPGGTRYPSKVRQSVQYFNPAALPDSG